jgi:hypothetical protein
MTNESSRSRSMTNESSRSRSMTNESSRSRSMTAKSRVEKDLQEMRREIREALQSFFRDALYFPTLSEQYQSVYNQLQNRDRQIQSIDFHLMEANEMIHLLSVTLRNLLASPEAQSIPEDQQEKRDALEMLSLVDSFNQRYADQIVET